LSELPSRRWQGSCSGSVNFGEGEVARMKSTKRLLTSQKAFVREEVKVKKVVEQETVEHRNNWREELDIEETVVRLRTELTKRPYLSLI